MSGAHCNSGQRTGECPALTAIQEREQVSGAHCNSGQRTGVRRSQFTAIQDREQVPGAHCNSGQITGECPARTAIRDREQVWYAPQVVLTICFFLLFFANSQGDGCKDSSRQYAVQFNLSHDYWVLHSLVVYITAIYDKLKFINSMMRPTGYKENEKQKGLGVGSRREGNAIVVQLHYYKDVLPTTMYYLLPRESNIL